MTKENCKILLFGTFSSAIFALFFTAFPTQIALASTPVSGALSADTTWTKAGSPYVIGESFVVPSVVTLAIEPGVVVKFNAVNSRPKIYGSILALGTAEDPIIFTSFFDDAHGGDTNGDGETTLPDPGDWRLEFYGTGFSGASSVFRHVLFSYSRYLYFSYYSAEFSDVEMAEFHEGLSSEGESILTINRFFAHDFESDVLLTYGNPSSIVGKDILIERGFSWSSDPVQLFAGSSMELDRTTIRDISDSAILVFGNSRITLSNSIIEDTGESAMSLYNGAAILDNVILRNGFDDGIQLFDDSRVPGTSSLVLKNSTIENFIGFYNAGIFSFDSSVTVENSKIQNNWLGIENFTGQRKPSEEPFLITNSSITGNIFGIENKGVKAPYTWDKSAFAFTPVTAAGNWWGDASGPFHETRNSEGLGDEVSDYVEFSPWLASDPTTGVPVTPPTLTEAGIAEDDGKQDTKGVVDKTNFTFDISYTGAAAPGDVTLWANDGTVTTQYPLALSATTTNDGDFTNGETFTLTRTFPKGHYGYHLEANGGTLRYPETGELSFTTGYSNVAFLPGLEASRLYRPATDPSDPSVTKVRLWEPPLFLQDNSQLFLNPDGTSIGDGIFTKDVVDETYFGINIYESFINSMNKNVTDGVIQGWKPLPYDWRFDIHNIVENPIALATTSYSMIEEIQKLAESSDTGKVTIVAHSNGGLVGKTLISEMEARGEVDVLDKFIMVAVPQLGTPKAIVALLHGEGLPTSFPVLLSKTDSRILAENMPSGYSLLPSAEYLSRVIDPVASFDSTDPLTAPYFAQYGSVVTNPTELHGFLLGLEGRTKSAVSDTFTPNILNETLLLQAQNNHTMLDQWKAPENVEVVQIAGWGVPTVSGLKYAEADACGGGGCIILDHEPVLTSDGDSTVVTPSAVGVNTGLVQTYYLNLKKQKKEHEDILESSPVLSFIKSIFLNSTGILPSEITTTKPLATADDDPSLRLKVHSPVSLHIYNSLGEHTGLATTTGNIQIIEKQISNSYYFEMGEGKYAGGDMAGTTTIKLVGESFGTFTIDLEKVIADNVVASTTFASIPVLASTTAIIELADIATSSVLVLHMDIDGDGAIDATISSGDGVTSQELLAILKGVIKTLNFPDEKEEKLLKRIEKIEKELGKEDKQEKEVKHKISEAFEKLVKEINKFEGKGLLTDGETAELISIIEEIKEKVVK
jgi:hypothetical protein